MYLNYLNNNLNQLLFSHRKSLLNKLMAERRPHQFNHQPKVTIQRMN
jgi:hypothetical protein